MIPASKIPEAQDGLIASVAEQVTVNREVPLDANQMMNYQAGQPLTNTVTDDFAWMLWFSDRPESLGVSFGVSGMPAEPTTVSPPPKPVIHRSAPPLTKGGSYTLIMSLKLHAGPRSKSPVVAPLNTGDAVVASGEEKNGFWAVTTVAGQTGWLLARDLKAN